MREFTSSHDGFEAELTVGERVALAGLAGELLLLIETHVDRPGSEEGAQDGLPRFSLGPVSAPEDAVLRRLLPDAAPREPEVSQEFRRFTQADLAASRILRLREFIALLVGDGVGLAYDATDPVSQERSSELLVERDRAQGFAATLTDLRLALSERLGLRTDEDSERLYEDVVAGWEGAQILDDDAQHMGTLFLFAGVLQESLLAQMISDLRS